MNRQETIKTLLKYLASRLIPTGKTPSSINWLELRYSHVLLLTIVLIGAAERHHILIHTSMYRTRISQDQHYASKSIMQSSIHKKKLLFLPLWNKDIKYWMTSIDTHKCTLYMNSKTYVQKDTQNQPKYVIHKHTIRLVSTITPNLEIMNVIIEERCNTIIQRKWQKQDKCI